MEEKARQLYAAVSKSAVHREYRDRITFMRGWSGQKVAATLRKACSYAAAHPEIDFAKIYAHAFSLRINGRIPSISNF